MELTTEEPKEKQHHYLASRSVYLLRFKDKDDGRLGVIDIVERYTGGKYKVLTGYLKEVIMDQLNDENTDDDYYHNNGFEKLAERKWDLKPGHKWGKLYDTKEEET